VTLGPANDDFPHADIEIELAGHLADVESRDPECAQIIEDVMQVEVDDDAFELLIEGMVEVALDRIAIRESPPRARTSLEMMIDRACGVPWSR